MTKKQPNRTVEIAGFDASEFEGLTPDAQKAVGVAAGLYRVVGLDEIRPDPSNARKKFDRARHDELVAAIREHGVLEPLLVVEDAPGYVLLGGERRWRAARDAGLTSVPVVVRPSVDPVAALVVNLQREAVDPFDLANAFGTLIEEGGMTQAELAKRLGKPKSYISEVLRLRSLPAEVKAQAEELGVGGVRALADLARQNAPQRSDAGVEGVGQSSTPPQVTDSRRSEKGPLLPAGLYLRITTEGKSVLVPWPLQAKRRGPVTLLSDEGSEPVDADQLPFRVDLVRRGRHGSRG